MFPFQQSNNNELCFQISSTTHQDITIREEDHQLIIKMLHDDSLNLKRASSQKNTTSSGDHGLDEFDHCTRKRVHRETEKRRRQDMAQLYSSLRSLLPLEYIKGKRSISDHTMEAVKYTEDLKKKINEMICKRDELKKMSNRRRFGGNYGNVDDPCPDIVQVNQCVGGLEILVGNGKSKSNEDVPLSQVLDTLLKEGLCVVSCASAMVNGRFLHTIRLEIGDGVCIDLPGLQWKLNQALGSMIFQKGKLCHELHV